MKILFLLGAASRIRNFDHAIADLADRGHVVCVTGRLRKGGFELPPTLQHQRISARVNPTDRVDEWRDAVDLLRGARDYVRYFDDRFAQATRLVRRAYEIAPTDFVLFCERHAWIKRHWKAAARVLALCEQLIPVDPGFEAFLRAEAPDIVLVTPLVTFESYQTDYVKAANHLGVPVGFIPFSWDNLTNKGLVRIQPDRVLVWNEVQRREAIELHGCEPSAVVVTGAARFDDFFDRRPASSRSEFCAQYGLDPSRPMLVYLGSSQLTGPNEMELIRRWAEAIRTCGHATLRDCALLIRPHPALSQSWESVDYSDLGQVAVSLHASRGADQELYDSLYHSHAAVGLNTSAMLEAAIVGRPVHTLVVPGFDEGQIGTMHFRYLVEAFGGLATVATSLEEHIEQLAPLVEGPPIVSERSRAFAGHFLRPAGIDAPVSRTLANEIERVGTIAKRPAAGTPLWHPPLRWILRRVLGRRTSAAAQSIDTTIVGTAMTLRPVKTALEELRLGTAPVFVGPFVDFIGNELLYWIPFVRWAVHTYGLAPERLIVVSRDGVGDWYGSLARRFLDATQLFSASELEHWSRRTVPQSQQNPKQAVMYPFDGEIIARAARAFDLSDYQILHPLTAFRVVNRFKKENPAQLGEVLRHEPRAAAAATARAPGLPKSFVAVSTSFTDALPGTDDNRRFLDHALGQLARKHEVVVVDGSIPESCRELPQVHALETTGEAMTPAAQAAVIARARSFVSGFGDMTIMAAFCGVQATAYYSDRLPVDQPERLTQAEKSGWGNVALLRARVKQPRVAEGADA